MSKEHEDFPGFTKDDFDAMDQADAAHDAMQNAVPEYDGEAARDADDLRREDDHEKSVAAGQFKPWERQQKADEPAAHRTPEPDHER